MTENGSDGKQWPRMDFMVWVEFFRRPEVADGLRGGGEELFGCRPYMSAWSMLIRHACGRQHHQRVMTDEEKKN